MIQISPTAAQEIKRIQRNYPEPTSYVRLQSISGGCLDFIYRLSLDTEPQEGDRHFNSRNIEILVNETELPQLTDLNIDYSEDLMGGGFRFTNPAVSKTCNCGQSFQK
jgi:iron-sulfur cluster assembly accessory protein